MAKNYKKYEKAEYGKEINLKKKHKKTTENSVVFVVLRHL